MPDAINHPWTIGLATAVVGAVVGGLVNAQLADRGAARGTSGPLIILGASVVGLVLGLAIMGIVASSAERGGSLPFAAGAAAQGTPYPRGTYQIGQIVSPEYVGSSPVWIYLDSAVVNEDRTMRISARLLGSSPLPSRGDWLGRDDPNQPLASLRDDRGRSYRLRDVGGSITTRPIDLVFTATTSFAGWFLFEAPRSDMSELDLNVQLYLPKTFRLGPSVSG
jgi:hypothetical protein